MIIGCNFLLSKITLVEHKFGRPAGFVDAEMAAWMTG